MYTQCPQCQTIFGVSEEHLSAAFGRVRCGHCHSQFNAKRHLLDKIPAQQPPPEPAPEMAKLEEIAPLNKSSNPTNGEISARQINTIPDNEMDYIDLSGPVSSTATPDEEITRSKEISADDLTLSPLPDSAETRHADPDAPEDLPAIPARAPLNDTLQEKEELDKIFAALDSRLEALSENTDETVIKPFEDFEPGNLKYGDYQDAFGDPDNQTEDDIRASIETIFAAAEAELGEQPAEQEISLQELITESDNDVESERQFEDSFITEHEAGSDNPELAPGDDTGMYLYEDKAENNASPDLPPTSDAAFAQEEFPFDLHEALEAELPSPRSWQKTLGLSVVSLVLLAAIALQLALFRNVELANKLPVLKPYLISFCQYMPCQFTGQRDVKRIHLTSRDVRTHPGAKNTILISAIFVNNARFDQPYPDILITLSDLTTTVVAQRRFTPADYLAQASAFQLMKAGKPVHITLEVLDPGNDAANFQFEFL